MADDLSTGRLETVNKTVKWFAVGVLLCVGGVFAYFGAEQFMQACTTGFLDHGVVYDEEIGTFVNDIEPIRPTWVWVIGLILQVAAGLGFVAGVWVLLLSLSRAIRDDTPTPLASRVSKQPSEAHIPVQEEDFADRWKWVESGIWAKELKRLLGDPTGTHYAEPDLAWLRYDCGDPEILGCSQVHRNLVYVGLVLWSGS